MFPHAPWRWNICLHDWVTTDGHMLVKVPDMEHMGLFETQLVQTAKKNGKPILQQKIGNMLEKTQNLISFNALA